MELKCPLCGADLYTFVSGHVCFECNSEFELGTMRYIGEGMCED